MTIKRAELQGFGVKTGMSAIRTGLRNAPDLITSLRYHTVTAKSLRNALSVSPRFSDF